MQIEEVIIIFLFILAVIYLYKKMKNTDDNCGNGSCKCD